MKNGLSPWVSVATTVCTVSTVGLPAVWSPCNSFCSWFGDLNSCHYSYYLFIYLHAHTKRVNSMSSKNAPHPVVSTCGFLGNLRSFDSLCPLYAMCMCYHGTERHSYVRLYFGSLYQDYFLTLFIRVFLQSMSRLFMNTLHVEYTSGGCVYQLTRSRGCRLTSRVK